MLPMQMREAAHMNLEKIGHWMTIVTNIGVLLGVVFLVVEINQNTEALKAQDEYANLDQWTGFFMATPQSTELARVIVKGDARYESLSPEEQLQYNGYYGSFLAIAEQSWYSIQAGRYYYGLPEHGRLVAFTLSSPGAHEYWAANKALFTPPFVAWVDGLLEDDQ
jgi:hypothetical protein